MTWRGTASAEFSKITRLELERQQAGQILSKGKGHVNRIFATVKSRFAPPFCPHPGCRLDTEAQLRKTTTANPQMHSTQIHRETELKL